MLRNDSIPQQQLHLHRDTIIRISDSLVDDLQVSSCNPPTYPFLNLSSPPFPVLLPQELLNSCTSEMSQTTSRIESSTAEYHHACAGHSHALDHLAEVQDAVSQLSRDMTALQLRINASYSGSFMCYRSIVAAAKASEASFCALLSPLIAHSESLMCACDDALRQLQVP
jgi:hypothetical protein